MNARAGIILAGALALSAGFAVRPAIAEELSEGAVKSFMEYAWSLTPQQFSKPDGKVIKIDKSKKNDVMVPIEVARDVIMAGRLSAHAQICDLRDEQVANHRAMMNREISKKKWTPQQLVYISQLHLTTIMLLTGRIRLVENEGNKEVVVDDPKAAKPLTCTDEQRKKVKELITAYVAASPGTKHVSTLPPADTPTATGSTNAKATAAQEK